MNSPLNMAAAIAYAPRFEGARAALGKALYWRYRLGQTRRRAAAVLERVGDAPLLVLPGVLNPRLMRSGAFMAAQLRSMPPAPQAQVLDMGTGSGVCALAVARAGCHVTAVDINPDAVRCARINALLNQLDHKIEILQGDLFAPVAQRRFDLILFNPPFVHGTAADMADRAWRSTDVAPRFAAGLAQHLTPHGAALVLLSSYGDAPRFLQQFERCALRLSLIAQRSYVNEKLTLLRVQAGTP